MFRSTRQTTEVEFTVEATRDFLGGKRVTQNGGIGVFGYGDVEECMLRHRLLNVHEMNVYGSQFYKGGFYVSTNV